MKMASRSSEDVKGHFPTWQNKKNVLVRVGGCYTDTSAPVILVNGIPQITLAKNEAGLLSLTFELRNKQDDVLAKMEDNWFTAYPPNVHDMTVTPNSKEVKVWLGRDDVGLYFSFRPVTMAELEEVLAHDRKISATQVQNVLEQLPAKQQGFPREYLQDDLFGARQPAWWIKELPDELRESHLAADKVGHYVKQWATQNCMMDDGLIPLLNFEQMAINFHGERITIKDGVASFIYYCDLPLETRRGQ